MDEQTEQERRHAGRFVVGYDLGPVGFWARVIIGVIGSSALLLMDLSSARGAFLLQVLLALVAVTLAYGLVYAALAPRVMARLHPWISTAIFYGPVLVIPYLSAVPIQVRVALVVYVIASTVIVLATGYGGCEVVGLPAAILHRHHIVYCPWNTVDLVDSAIARWKWAPSRKLTGLRVVAVGATVAVVIGVGSQLDEAFPLVWVITAATSVALVTLARMLDPGAPSRRS